MDDCPIWQVPRVIGCATGSMTDRTWQSVLGVPGTFTFTLVRTPNSRSRRMDGFWAAEWACDTGLRAIAFTDGLEMSSRASWLVNRIVPAFSI